MTSIKDVATDLNRFKFEILPIDLLLKYNFNTLESIKEVTSPVLILHSKDDQLVKYFTVG